MTHNLSAVTLDQRGGRAKLSVYIGADVITDPKRSIGQGERFQMSYAQTATNFVVHLTPVKEGGITASPQPSPDRPLRLVHSGAWRDKNLKGWHPFKMVRSSVRWDDTNKMFIVDISKSLAKAHQPTEKDEVEDEEEPVEVFAPGPVLVEMAREAEANMRRSILNEVAVWLLRNAHNYKAGELAGAMLEDLDHG